jgi:hypothetical protein
MSHVKYHKLTVDFTIPQAYVNHLCHHTTRRGYHKHDVSPHNQFKGGRPNGSLDIGSENQYLHVKNITPVEIHCY